jgi:hypothetical protein
VALTLEPAMSDDTAAPPPPAFGMTDPGCRVEALRISRRNGIAVTLTGALRAATILTLLDSLEVAEPAFVLIDESELKVGLIGPGDIQRIAHRWSIAKNLRDAAIAVVAPNPVVYGLNRMFQLVSDADTRLAVFWNRAAAVNWVGTLDRPAD